jgi:hypothetical protein
VLAQWMAIHFLLLPVYFSFHRQREQLWFSIPAIAGVYQLAVQVHFHIIIVVQFQKQFVDVQVV